MTRMYSVRRPIMSTAAPECWTAAEEISRHLTPESARARIVKETAALKRQPGRRDSYLDWYVCQSDDGGRTWDLYVAEEHV